MKILKNIINEEVESYLNEVGEGTLQPYEYKENTAHDDMFYEFTTEDGDGYVVSILKAQSPALKYQDIYDVEFKVYGYTTTYHAVTNKGRVYRIMATIVEIVKNFLNDVKPNILYFQPTKNKGEGDMRRMNLYLAYVKKAASNNPDYFFENTNDIAVIIRKSFFNPSRYEDLLAFQSDMEIRLRQIDPNTPEAETIESLLELFQKYVSKAGKQYRGEIRENQSNGNDLIADINNFLNTFFYSDVKYKDIIYSCDLSKGNCTDVVEELGAYLQKSGYDSSRLKIIELKLPSFSLDKAHPEMRDEKNMYHDVLKVDDKYIDLTGAQFGEEFAGVKIYTLDELKKYWNKITNVNTKINENNLNENTYKVYHGTNEKFGKFNFNKTAQGIIWFTDSIDSIQKGEHGGQGNKYIMTRYITINNPAGWKEYEKYGLGQLQDMGYDGVILPQGDKTDYFVFSNKNISAKPINLTENNVISNVINDEVQAWHGSQYDFDKFDANKIGTGDGGDVYGWGIYFTNSEEIGRHYGKDGYTYLVTLHKGKTPDQYDWLKWNAYITPEQRIKITNQAQKENIELFLVDNDYYQSYLKKMQDKMATLNDEEKNKLQHKIDLNYYDDIKSGIIGYALYDGLAGVFFKSKKEASLFLLRAGIDGIIFPANRINNYMEIDKTKDFNYVIFDPNAVTIEKKIPTKNTGSEKVNENAGNNNFNDNFWKWFGNSKVVNPDGSPMVVYHGTRNDFNVFDRGVFGYHFGTLSQAEDRLIHTSKIDINNIYGKNANMLPVYLSIQNPFPMPDLTSDDYDAFEFIHFLEGKKQEKPVFTPTSEDMDYIYDAINDDDITGEQSGADVYRRIKEIIMRHGFDGAYYDNMYEGTITTDDEEVISGGKSWVAFKPEQIKSVTGNNGDYNPNNPDITKESVEAWHGSPYDFDKFDASKIGSGEGAQAFGWGLYFTDLEDVARNYANVLTDLKYGTNLTLIQAYLNSTKNFISNPKKYSNELFRVYEDDKYEYFVNTANNYHSSMNVLHDNLTYAEALPYLRKRYENLKKAYENSEKGNITYMVTLHKGKTPDQYDWLLWDKPITKSQREKISAQAAKENIEFFLTYNNAFNSYQKKMQDKMDKSTGELAFLNIDSLKGQIRIKEYYIVNDVDGEEVYKLLSSKYFNSDKETSLFLLRAGIDGIKYPVGTIMTNSRYNSGFNYVVFDPNAVTIEKKIATKNTDSETVNEDTETTSAKDGDKYFNNKSTGMGLYDSVLNQGGGEGYQYWNKGYEGEVVYMSPDEYLDKTKKGFGNNRDFDENHILYSRKSQMAIIDAIKQGNKIDMPMLDYSKKGYFGQEGRHRAIVARALGIKEMPVFILYGVTSQDKIKRLNGIIREALKTLDLTGNIDADTKTIQNYIKDNYGNRAHEYMTWTRPDILKNILNRIYEKDNANNDNVNDIVKEEIQNIDEGYKEAYELSIIAGDVINYFSKYNSAMLINIKNDGKLSPQNLHFDVNNVPLSTIADDLNKYSKEIQDFITSGKVTIRFGLSRNTSGGYDGLSKSIFLNLLKKTFVLSMHQNGLIRLDSNLSTTNKPINNSEELLKKMMNETLKDTIIHELQHAYDAYRSKGRYDKDKQSREYYAALLQNNGISSVVDKGGRFVNIDKYNQYLNLPHEYWARFSQTLNGMDMERDFNDVLNDFKWRFRGYEVLSPEAKKRILNSLYKYHELRNAKAAE